MAIGAEAAKKNEVQINNRVTGLYQDILGPSTDAEYVLVDASKETGSNARKLPEKLSFQEGAAYPLVFGTAQTMFYNIAKDTLFRNILVIGGTSVGRSCVQLGSKVYGSTKIVVNCSGKSEEVKS